MFTSLGPLHFQGPNKLKLGELKDMHYCLTLPIYDNELQATEVQQENSKIIVAYIFLT